VSSSLISPTSKHTINNLNDLKSRFETTTKSDQNVPAQARNNNRNSNKFFDNRALINSDSNNKRGTNSIPPKNYNESASYVKQKFNLKEVYHHQNNKNRTESSNLILNPIETINVKQNTLTFPKRIDQTSNDEFNQQVQYARSSIE
jgi:hypothetical protein